MVLRGATSLWGALEGVGPENRDFFGPWNGTSEASAIWAQKKFCVLVYCLKEYTEMECTVFSFENANHSRLL